MKQLKKSTKVWIILLAVFLVLAIVVLSLVFGWINDYRFMTYTKSKVNKAIAAYSGNPLRFVAHRGLSGEAYQNTEKAFRLAADYDGVWAIETDVWVTSDGGFVCMHDKNALKGVSDVSKITLEEALSTPLKGNTEERAPSLETFLNVCKSGGKVAFVELKDKKMSAQAMDSLLERIHAVGADVRVISFHFSLLNYIRSKDSDIGLIYLYNLAPSSDVPGSTRNARLKNLVALRMDIGVNSMFLKKKDVRIMHDGGREVNAWTVNSARNAVLFAYEFDVDILTSDIRMADEVAKFIS